MTDNRPLILVIDDEVQIRRLLEITLTSAGYRMIAATTGEEGARRAAMDHPDLVILDLGLPDRDGREVLRQLREWSTLPVIILSVRNAEEEIVACLDAGADDYLVKPFRAQELLARLRTAVRHQPSVLPDTQFSSGTLEVDLEARLARKSGKIIKLTATEFRLLALFVRNAGKVLTHRYILEQVWGPAHIDETDYTRVYVGQLRKKIEDDHTRPSLLITESGIGYRLATDETSGPPAASRQESSS